MTWYDLSLQGDRDGQEIPRQAVTILKKPQPLLEVVALALKDVLAVLSLRLKC